MHSYTHRSRTNVHPAIAGTLFVFVFRAVVPRDTQDLRKRVVCSAHKEENACRQSILLKAIRNEKG